MCKLSKHDNAIMIVDVRNSSLMCAIKMSFGVIVLLEKKIMKE